MKKQDIINCTPHAIMLNNGVVFPPSEIQIRVQEESWLEDTLNVTVSPDPEDESFGVDLFGVEYDLTESDLPEAKLGVRYIVSGKVLDAIKANGIKRYDFWAPATGHVDARRNDKGQIISVPGFIRLY